MIMIIIYIMGKQTQNTVENLNADLPTTQNSAPSPRLYSKNLFATVNEVVIEHAGEEYRLRLTRQGKLILTK